MMERINFSPEFGLRVRRFLTMQTALLPIVLALRLYEFIAAGSHHTLPDGIIDLFVSAVGADLGAFGIFTLLAGVVYIVVSSLNETTGDILLIASAVIVVTVSVLLDQYFFVTFVPLGADLFGYTMSDIMLTVRSSGGYDILSLIPFVLFIGVTVAVMWYSKSRPMEKPSAILFSGIFALFIPIFFFAGPRVESFSTEREYDLACNKVVFFISHTVGGLHAEATPVVDHSTNEYPLLHDDPNRDVLGTMFDLGKDPPNIVFLIVEGLGRSFVGEGAEFQGFTPFLDSLTERSLYWENFLSTSGRTFGVLPGLLGSLPYGESGFMEMGYKMPSHVSLISLLNDAGYSSSYYYGGNVSFDHQNVFLERQKTSFILDQSNFGPRYTKTDPDEQGFTWGYSDGDLFKRAFECIDERSKSPRLDIYMTLSTHEPFITPHREYYEAEFGKRLERLPISPEKKQELLPYKKPFASLLYTDEMIREFFAQYAKRKDFANTIIFITGDHRMIPVPLNETIDRFHVPLIIFSPMLKRTARFSSVSSHLDVAPTLLSLLGQRYGFRFPHKVSWLGDGIDTAREFRNLHSLPLMRNKNELIDYLDRKHYVAGGLLYELQDHLTIALADDEKQKDDVVAKLAKFRELNEYVCRNNKVYPLQDDGVKLAAAANDDSLLAARKLLGLPSDSLYKYARQKAIQRQFADARLVCNYLLRDNPDFHDIRVLLGLTYAWDGRPWDAEPVYREVLRRAPHYADAVVSLSDIEIWQGHYEVALEFIGKEEAFIPKNKDLLFRKGKALFLSGRLAEARLAFAALAKLDPSYEDAKAFRKRFKNAL